MNKLEIALYEMMVIMERRIGTVSVAIIFAGVIGGLLLGEFGIGLYEDYLTNKWREDVLNGVYLTNTRNGETLE